MPRNDIVLHVNGEPWTVAGLISLAGALTLGFAVIAGVVIVWLWGTSRRLSASEAARVATHPAESSYVDRALVAHGPAAGREWGVSISIGDLRHAWHSGDYFKFCFVPLAQILLWGGISLLLFGLTVGLQTWLPFGTVGVLSVPLTFLPLFMMWAAVNTKLN